MIDFPKNSLCKDIAGALQKLYDLTDAEKLSTPKLAEILEDIQKPSFVLQKVISAPLGSWLLRTSQASHASRLHLDRASRRLLSVEVSLQAFTAEAVSVKLSSALVVVRWKDILKPLRDAITEVRKCIATSNDDKLSTLDVYCRVKSSVLELQKAVRVCSRSRFGAALSHAFVPLIACKTERVTLVERSADFANNMAKEKTFLQSMTWDNLFIFQEDEDFEVNIAKLQVEFVTEIASGVQACVNLLSPNAKPDEVHKQLKQLALALQGFEVDGAILVLDATDQQFRWQNSSHRSIINDFKEAVNAFLFHSYLIDVQKAHNTKFSRVAAHFFNQVVNAVDEGAKTELEDSNDLGLNLFNLITSPVITAMSAVLESYSPTRRSEDWLLAATIAEKQNKDCNVALTSRVDETADSVELSGQMALLLFAFEPMFLEIVKWKAAIMSSQKVKKGADNSAQLAALAVVTTTFNNACRESANFGKMLQMIECSFRTSVMVKIDNLLQYLAKYCSSLAKQLSIDRMNDLVRVGKDIISRDLVGKVEKAGAIDDVKAEILLIVDDKGAKEFKKLFKAWQKLTMVVPCLAEAFSAQWPDWAGQLQDKVVQAFQESKTFRILTVQYSCMAVIQSACRSLRAGEQRPSLLQQASDCLTSLSCDQDEEEANFSSLEDSQIASLETGDFNIPTKFKLLLSGGN